MAQGDKNLRERAQQARKAQKNVSRVATVVRTMVRLARFLASQTIRLISALVSIGWPVLVFIIIIAVIAIGASSAASLGNKLAGLAGISKTDLAFLKNVDEDTLKEIKQATRDDVLTAFDCSNYKPSERKPGVNCIPGLLASEDRNKQGPIPKRAEYLVPVWKAAASRYQVPWQLLAAVNAARTNFGWINCQRKDGIGFYRLEQKAYDKYGVNGGYTPLRKTGLACKTVPKSITNNTTDNASLLTPPVTKRFQKKLKKKQPKLQITASKKPLNKIKHDQDASTNSDPFDPVDAAYTDARLLASNGAFKTKKWNYSGSRPNQCSTNNADGKVWYLPETGLAGFGAGAKLGYNKKLAIPRNLVLLAAKYRSNKGKYKPRRSGSAEDSRLGYHPIPKKDIIKLLKGVWYAFGVRGAELNANVEANYAQIGLESGGRPYILQGYIGDVNDNNPAGGLMQFIPSTFDHWKVDGFNDRFNPIDNILATVNAQVNGPYPILNGSSGWSPPLSNNPYSSGGRFSLVGPGTSAATGKPVRFMSYKGPKQTDRVSKAVSYKGPGGSNSACYVAVVYEWYDAIVKHPPPSSTNVALPAGTKKLYQPRKFVKIPKEIWGGSGEPDLIDARILPNAMFLMKKFDSVITQGRWDPGSPSVSHGDGVALDIVPAPGKSWDGVTKMAEAVGWKRDCGGSGVRPACPLIPAIRFVGYDGYPNHGTGNHLHIGWTASSGSCCGGGVGGPPPEWVIVFGQEDTPKLFQRGGLGNKKKKPRPFKPKARLKRK